MAQPGDAPAPDLSTLREELLASVAAIFDRAVEIGRRQGAKAVLDTINDAASKLGGLSGGDAPASGRPPGAVAPPAKAQEALWPPAAAERARAGAVQGAVLEVLERSPKALAPLRIVDAGKAMGLDLKVSSVRMALKALCRDNRVEQDARGDYRLAPGGGGAQGDAPAAPDTNPT